MSDAAQEDVLPAYDIAERIALFLKSDPNIFFQDTEEA